MAFDLRKIWQLLQGTSLRDEYEIPVSEGQASGDTRKYNISQLKAHIWAFVQQQIGQISQGPQGPSGTAGQQGQPGPAGNKGDKGDRGESGLKGDTGPHGPIGIQGPKGDKGDLGATGEQGTQGIQGELGPRGEQGPQGEQGIQGEQGKIGETGKGHIEIIPVTTEGSVYFEIDFTINNRLTLFGSYPEIEWWSFDGLDNEGNRKESLQSARYVKSVADGVLVKATIQVWLTGYIVIRSGNDMPQEESGSGYFEKIPFTRDMETLVIDFSINNRLANFGLYPHLETYIIPAQTVDLETPTLGAFSRHLTNGVLSSMTFYPVYENGYILIKSRADLYIPNPGTEAGHYEVIPFEATLNEIEVDFMVNNRQQLFGLYPHAEIWLNNSAGAFIQSSMTVYKTMADGLISKLSFLSGLYMPGYIVIKSSHDLSVPLPPVVSPDHYEIIPFSGLVADQPGITSIIDFTQNNRQKLFGLYPYVEIVNLDNGREYFVGSSGTRVMENGVIKSLIIGGLSSPDSYVVLKSSPSVLIPSPEPESVIKVPAGKDYTIGTIGDQTMVIVPNNTDGISRTLTFPDPAANPAKIITFFLPENWNAQSTVWNLKVTGGSKLIDPRGGIFNPDHYPGVYNAQSVVPDLFVFQSTGENWLAINNRYSNYPTE